MTDARTRARELVVFCAGFDEGGLYPDFSRRARVVAADLLQALDELDVARSALAAMTADRDRWRDDRWRQAHAEAWPA